MRSCLTMSAAQGVRRRLAAAKPAQSLTQPRRCICYRVVIECCESYVLACVVSADDSAFRDCRLALGWPQGVWTMIVSACETRLRPDAKAITAFAVRCSAQASGGAKLAT